MKFRLKPRGPGAFHFAAALITLAFCHVPQAHAATFTVTSTNDSGAGTLRQAIENANGTAGLDTIAFNIAGTGVKTIAPISNLPNITDYVTVDGTTQPGYSGVPLIELNGENAPFSDGLNFQAPVSGTSRSAVKGLIINRFAAHGIQVGSPNNPKAPVTITGNYIGTNAAGAQSQGNAVGISIYSSSGNTIGGTSAGSRNLISGNTGDGILFFGANGLRANSNTVMGNYIGTDITGNLAIPNGGNGVHITDSDSNIVGGAEPGMANRSAFNAGSGVCIDGTSSTGNAIRGNQIFKNLLLGIDLSPPDSSLGQPTANDLRDADTGPNDLQNKPEITGVTAGATSTVNGSLNSRPNRIYIIDFYSNAGLEETPAHDVHGEGGVYLGHITTATDNSGNANFTLTATTNLAGRYITATALQSTAGEGFNSTSEFSSAFAVDPPPAGSFQFSATTYSVNENGGIATIAVTRTGSTATPAEVGYITSDGTAKAGNDYTAASGVLSFAAGITSKSFTIPITNDSDVEPNETVNLALNSVTGAEIGTPSTATLTIVSDDQPAPPAVWRATDLAVGGDNLARLLWTKPDKAFALWTLSASNGITSTPLYGPIAGINASAIAVGGDAKIRVLLNSTDGKGIAWTVQNPSTGNITSTPAYGPFSGLTCREVASGPDNTTRLLWVRSDGAFAVWTVDAAGNFTSTPLFGPIAGWSANAISVGGDNKTTILINHTDGRAAVWTVQNASTGAITSTPAFGPISGFSCRDIATGSDNKTRMLWVRTDGGFAVWTADAAGNFTSTPLYGPIAGWSAPKVGVGGDLKARILLTHTDGRAVVWTVQDAAGNITSTPAYGPIAVQ